MIQASVDTPLINALSSRHLLCTLVSEGARIDPKEYMSVEEVRASYMPLDDVVARYIHREGLRVLPVRIRLTINQGG